MSRESLPDHIIHLDQVVAQKEAQQQKHRLTDLGDTCSAWINTYLDLAVTGTRNRPVAAQIGRHLRRFSEWFRQRYGHERLSLCLKRDVLAWLAVLEAQESEAQPPLSPATVNSHLASLSGFCSWVEAHQADFFQMSNPCRGVPERPLPALRPDTLSATQVLTLKSTLARLPALYARHGLRHVERQRKKKLSPETQARRRPYRDRALIELLLSTGLRREELVMLDLTHLEANAHPGATLTPEILRQARRVQLADVRGKGKHFRNLFLSADARAALADYLEYERVMDAAHFGAPQSLFLRAWNAPAPRDPGNERIGRLATNTINVLVARIGELHDGEQSDPTRKIGHLHPHQLRHAFAFRLAETTSKDTFELQRRLGHQSERYIGVYTNPPEEIAAGYVEDF